MLIYGKQVLRYRQPAVAAWSGCCAVSAGRGIPMRREGGFSLLEVMAACAILAILCVGALGAVMKVDQDNRYLYNCTIAHRAAHQMMEILLSMDLDDVVNNQNGQTFTVAVPAGPPATGTITVTDLNYGGVAGRAYEYRVSIPEYSVSLVTIRART